MSEYNRHYATLDAEPGCSWRELRQAYRIMVRRWHPDHYEGQGDKHRDAENRLKDINHAFRCLAEYRRIHGHLPLSAGDEAGLSWPPPSSQPPASAMSNRAELPKFARFLFLGMGLAILYVAVSSLFDPHSVVSTEQAQTRSLAGRDQSHAPEHFTFGSRPTDVYMVQGMPTSTGEQVWHYAESRVYFKQGRVAGWSSTRYPLNTSTELGLGGYITRTGDPLADLRATQKTTTEEAKQLWAHEPLKESDVAPARP